MTKQGFADFLKELRREKLRHQTPFSTFLARLLEARPKRSTAKKLKELRESASVQQELYARYIDDSLVAWEEKQQTTVAEARKPVKGDEPDSPAKALLTVAGFAAGLADLRADALAATFDSIRFYLGDLNRDVNESRVATYRAAMEKGDWWFTPDPIVVTDAGDIINGQHRLLAVEGQEIDPAPQFVVVWGVDKRAAILMDEARRTATDRRNIAIRYANSSGGEAVRVTQ